MQVQAHIVREGVQMTNIMQETMKKVNMALAMDLVSHVAVKKV